MDKASLHFDPQRKTQILVVEDERIIAINLKESLEALGYAVPAIAATAERAIEEAVNVRPDLVLMDIRLKGDMDGIDAAEYLWNTLQVPIIYVTGHSDRSTLERAKETVPFGYILKPVKERELYVAIETALQRHEREQTLMAVLRSMGDGVIVVDTHGHIMFLNRIAELLTGWQQQDARGRELMEVFNLIHEETRQPLENRAIAAIQQDMIVYLEERVVLVAKDGTTIPVTDSVAPLTSSKGLITGAVIVFRDDSQRRLAEEHSLTLQRAQILERQMNELQRLNQLKDNQLKDDALSSISYRLQMPLTTIKMAIQTLEVVLNQQNLLNTEPKPTSNQMDRYLKILHDQYSQELTLVSDLLELQHLESEVCSLDLNLIELQDSISHLIDLFQERAQHHKQRLQTDLPSNLPLLVSDPAILSRILTELLINACKYTPPGEEITVSVQPLPITNRIQLKVTNTGIEIPADELPRIFDKFYRIPTSDRWQQGGTGLGLALVKKLVAYLGGFIWAESNSGQTCFTVELPVNPSEFSNVAR
ncbi:MAG: response regulator [Leptolyngbyaceae cyanobacterium RU_5_1]|nr:response regulator [Leptolyngbyaceae cyanobacterium RU_5_1]